MRTIVLTAAACLTLLTACNRGQPNQTVAQQVVPAGEQLQQVGDGTYVYRTPNIDVRKYHGIYVAPTVIYNGPDAVFDGVTQQDVQDLAQLATTDFRRELATKYIVVDQPTATSITLQLTLAGITRSRPGMDAATKLNPVGLFASVARGAAGKPSAFVGSATLAGEITASASGEVLGGFVAKRSPQSFDIDAALSTQDAAAAAIGRGAADFRAALDRVTGR
jgi:hypothetical protein